MKRMLNIAAAVMVFICLVSPVVCSEKAAKKPEAVLTVDDQIKKYQEQLEQILAGIKRARAVIDQLTQNALKIQGKIELLQEQKITKSGETKSIIQDAILDELKKENKK